MNQTVLDYFGYYFSKIQALEHQHELLVQEMYDLRRKYDAIMNCQINLTHLPLNKFGSIPMVPQNLKKIHNFDGDTWN